MLYLTRKVGETIVINETIHVTVMEVKGQSVSIGFTFPPSASILRKELHEKIADSNKKASLSFLENLLKEGQSDA